MGPRCDGYRKRSGVASLRAGLEHGVRQRVRDATGGLAVDPQGGRGGVPALLPPCAAGRLAHPDNGRLPARGPMSPGQVRSLVAVIPPGVERLRTARRPRGVGVDTPWHGPVRMFSDVSRALAAAVGCRQRGPGP